MENSPASTAIPDLADHALVLIFRPYKVRWIQPTAVFSAKNAATGSQLYKIALKAMILLEEANAWVQTTVCNGSQPNNVWWALFGISNSDTSQLNHSIMHPTSGSLVFFLRDVPHIFKCIRNHILSQGCSNSCNN